jgi:PII-like signaling protein
MNAAVALRFYVHESRKHRKVLFEWLLEKAKESGIHGGSAFAAIAGFGRHGVIHEHHLLDLADDLPVMVEFIVSEKEADQLIAIVRGENLHVFCTRTRTEVVVIDER